jgi:hypothetical protein
LHNANPIEAERMQQNHSVAGKNAVVVLVVSWIGVVITGCSSRTLSWTSLTEPSQNLSSARRVAVATSVSAIDEHGMFGACSGELTSAITAELLARGYRITLLRDQGHTSTSRRSKDVLTARADTQPAAQIQHEVSVGGDGMTARYRAAREIGAELLFEFTIQSNQKMVTHTSISPIPLVPHSSTMEWKQQIRQITLNVSSAADQTILGTTTVHFDSPTDKIQDAVKDLLLGLDMFRQGKPNGKIELTGKPGTLPK